MTDRILWNRRPDPLKGWDREQDIDEIVIHGCTVHVEQMDNRCWWIGVTKTDDPQVYWSGNFSCDSRGRMRFTEQESRGIVWGSDLTHEFPDPAEENP